MHPALCQAASATIPGLRNQPHGSAAHLQLARGIAARRLGRGSRSGRDQVWFTEKGHDGASRLYALSDLSPRSEEAIGRRYLAGRSGATPILAAEEFAEVVLNAANEPS